MRLASMGDKYALAHCGGPLLCTLRNDQLHQSATGTTHNHLQPTAPSPYTLITKESTTFKCLHGIHSKHAAPCEIQEQNSAPPLSPADTESQHDPAHAPSRPHTAQLDSPRAAANSTHRTKPKLK